MSSSTPPAETVSRPTKILSKKNLISAWLLSRDASSKPGGPGIDKVKAHSFAAKLDEMCDQIVRDVRNGNVNFSKLRAKPIPKPGTSKERLICIPTVRDRLIQRTMLAHIAKKITIFEVSKYAFKDNGGTHKAIQECKRLRANYSYVAKTDIIQFFDTISRPKLKARCKKVLGRSSLIPMLYRVIDTEISVHNSSFTKKHGVARGKGLRQGMPLSPLLANLALYDLDKYITKKKVPALRYVDDLIIFANSKKEAEKYIESIATELSKLDLGIPNLCEDSKTQIFGPTATTEFLGVEIYFSEKHDGWEHKVPEKQIEKIESKIIDLGDLDVLLSKEQTLYDFAVKVASQKKAYKSAYKGARNLDRLVQVIDKQRNKATLDILTQLFGIEAVENLDERGKRFLNLSFNNVDADF